MLRLALSALACSTLLSPPALAGDVRETMGSILVDPRDPKAIEAKCDSYLDAVTARKTLLESGQGKATIDNALTPYDEAVGLLSAASGEFELYQQVLLTPQLRDAGGACLVRISSLSSKLDLSRPVFDRLSAVDARGADEKTRGYLKETLAGFERAGVALPDGPRARVQAIQDELGELSTTFARNIAESIGKIEVRPEELAGLPADFLAARKPGASGTITLTTAYPDYQPVMTYAESEDLRQRFSRIYGERGWPQNDEVLRRILTLRAELAKILGRKSYAALALENKMLATPARVEKLIADSHAAARPAAEQDYARNLAVLKTLDPKADRIDFWDSSFVAAKAQRALYNFDRQEARRYFAYNNVRDGVLRLTEDLFGITIRQWDTAVWHPDVEAYEMVDGGKVIGRFYFDNHPRPGKYTHANMIPIYPGIAGKDVPVGALVQNLPKGDHSTGLMEHSQVETLLHEFGHMIHGMFGGTQRWLGQNILTVEWDMIEAPSQMLQNWVYDYDTLAKFAVDARGNTIPRELVEKMNRARYFNQGLFEMTQLGLSNISLRFHSEPVPGDLGAATRGWRNRYDPIKVPEYNQMQASFSHLDGYSAYYYTYLWSRVVGADLFTRFEKAGIRDRATADAYRRLILEPGGSLPASVMIRNFLGRDVSLDAFRGNLAKGLK